MSSEATQREQVVAIARQWLGTPYVSNAMIRGARGGVDCAMLLVAVFGEAGLIPKEFDPRPYSPQWHLHRNEERYLELVLRFAREIGEADARPGDIVLFKVGRLYAHGGIIVEWPHVINARAPSQVSLDNVYQRVGKHGLAYMPRRFFSYWGAEAHAA